MQSATFTLSSSLRLPKPRRLSSATLNPKFDPIRTSASLKPNTLHTIGTLSASLPRRSWSPSSSSSNFKLRPWRSLPLVDSDAGTSRFEVRATAESAEESSESSSMFKTLELGALFSLWYLFNIYFNIYNKQVLKVFPYPVTVTGIQFAAGTVLVLLMWGLNIYKKPKVSGAQLAAILPLAVVHTLGNLFTNMSLGKVAVSFTHTIKASKPFFSVILSAMFLEVIQNGATFVIVDKTSNPRDGSPPLLIQDKKMLRSSLSFIMDQMHDELLKLEGHPSSINGLKSSLVSSAELSYIFRGQLILILIFLFSFFPAEERQTFLKKGG